MPRIPICSTFENETSRLQIRKSNVRRSAAAVVFGEIFALSSFEFQAMRPRAAAYVGSDEFWNSARVSGRAVINSHGRESLITFSTLSARCPDPVPPPAPAHILSISLSFPLRILLSSPTCLTRSQLPLLLSAGGSTRQEIS